MDPRVLLLPLRIGQFILALIVFCLSCYVVDKTDGWISEENFMVFAGLWTFLLAVPYLTLCTKFFPDAAHKYALLAVDAGTMIFWFAGFIALGAYPAAGVRW